jgi:hypothetical protein
LEAVTFLGNQPDQLAVNSRNGHIAGKSLESELRAALPGEMAMRIRISIAIAAGLLALFAHVVPLKAADPTVAGLWEQTDEKGRVGGWFFVFEHDGVYEGALVKIFPKPGEDPNPICTKCSGAQKNMPSLGLIMIEGMQRKGLVYDNGTILDPRDGTVYHATMEVSLDGQSLTLRGYWGIPLFGKSQVWTRLPDDALSRDAMPENLLQFLPAKPGSPTK